MSYAMTREELLALPLRERLLRYFNARVTRSSDCWKWSGAVDKRLGYAYASVGRFYHGPAHRLAYELFKGPIPKGLHIDHLCRNRGCVNPDHLEPVTCKQNVLRGVGPSAENARKTHCSYGHALSGDNVFITSKGFRQCRECHRKRDERLSFKRRNRTGKIRKIMAVTRVRAHRYDVILACGHKKSIAVHSDTSCLCRECLDSERVSLNA